MDTNYSSGSSDKGTNKSAAGTSITGTGSSGLTGTNTPGSGSGSASPGMSTAGSSTASGAGSSGSMSSGAGKESASWSNANKGSESEDAGYDDTGRHEHGGGASLRENLAAMKTDLDELIAKASGLSDGDLKAARDQLMAKFGSMRHRAKGMANQASQQLNQGMDVTSDYVKEKPLQSVAMAAGLGLLIGAILRRH